MFDDLPLFFYDVAVIDPPWKYELYSDKGKAKSPDAHYSCMSMDEIAALRVGDLLAPAGVVVCWCTWPLIEEQYRVVRAWGLLPVTGGVWAKRTINGKFRWGTGYVLRSVCEPFVIAKLPGARLDGRSIINMVKGAREVMETCARTGAAPVTANLIRAVEHLLFAAEYKGEIEADRIAALYAAMPDFLETEARRFAAERKAPVWRGLASVIFMNRRKARG